MRNSISKVVVHGILLGLMVTGVIVAKPGTVGIPGRSTGVLDQPDGSREQGASVSTAFGIYQPYAIPKYQPIAGHDEPALAANFTNVTVAGGRFPWNSYFLAAERKILVENGFVVRPEALGTFAQAYSAELAAEPMGSFVTVDAVLHGLRVTAAEAMREMERTYAAPTLANELSDLSGTISERLAVERNQTIKGSLVQLLGYVQTAEVLLNPSVRVDPAVAATVSAEVKKIGSAQGELPSSVFPQRTIDYARFAPGGYYAADTRLSAYYRTARWLSHVGFALRRAGGGFDLGAVRNAGVLARMINSMPTADEFKQTLRNINEPTAFFNGHEEQVASWDILGDAMEMYYGRIVTLGPQFLADDAMLPGFAKYLAERLPDSEAGGPVFHLLEWDPENGHGLIASFAKRGNGLGLLAALGSPRAAEMAGSLSGFSTDATQRLSGSVASWMRDIDHAVLYTLRGAVAADRGDGYPRFMQSAAWNDRELTSILGAVADYQHPVATLPMQSRVRAGRVTSGGVDVAGLGYVEPNPEAWARLAGLAGYIRNGLVDGRGDRLIGRTVEAKLSDIENTSAKLMQISAAELNGKDLTADQLALLASMRDRIAAYESFADKSLQGNGYVIAAGAGHADGGPAMANGHPLVIYAIVPRTDGEEGLMLVRGAVYSYFETTEDDAEFRRLLVAPDEHLDADRRLSGRYMSNERGMAQDPSKFYGLNAPLPATAAYTPGKTERFASSYRAVLHLEASLVSRARGEVWFTVKAPNLEGTALVASITDAAGQVVQHADIGRIQNGERLDVLSVDKLTNGEYYLHVEDAAGTLLATGRFIVVQ